MNLKKCQGGQGLPPGFVELPHLVYKQDPLWIPEEPPGVEYAFGSDNPWFAQGRALSLCVEKQARLSVFCHPEARIEGRQVAFFGFWESVEDQAINESLFQVAGQWASEQGAQALYGPINFSTYGKYRLRIKAPKQAVPFIGEPYNPPYYPDLLASLGFQECQRYVSRGFPEHYLEPFKQVWEEMLAGVLRQGYRLECFDFSWWMDNLKRLHQDIELIFGDNFAYTSLSWPEFERACGASMVQSACPHASVIAFGPDNDLAGFFLAYPHYGPLVVQAAGENRIPVSALRYETHRLLLDKQLIRTLVMKTVGVHPRHRRLGLSQAFSIEVCLRGINYYNYFLTALQRQDSVLDKSVVALQKTLDQIVEQNKEYQVNPEALMTPLGQDRYYGLFMRKL